MKKEWSDLLQVLAAIYQHYQETLQLGKIKKEALVAYRVAELEELTKKEESLILQISRLEGQRAAIVRQIAAFYQLEGDAISLEAVRKLADPEVEQQMLKLQEDFVQVLSELAQINKVNAALIEQGLFFINYNLNIMTQNSVEPAYASRGQAIERAPGRRVFDSKA
ncbi:MAG TPA: flagellar protein FlgN [Patescibacteria group bacterium]|nr:flagellar protein FlgN [Patescibacteria group bacterium]